MTDEIKMVLDEIKSLKNNVKSVQMTLENDVKPVQTELVNNVKSVQMTLENETNNNIKLIAEGHLDISRKLDEALKVENEKELLLIRVNTLENEVRKLKERIDQIA